MKKKYFYLIGFIITLVLNYLIKNYSNLNYTENLNQVNIFEIIRHGLEPIVIFLLINFLFKKGIKIQPLAIFIFVLIIIESMIHYYKGKEIIDYNYTIGMILGLFLTFLIDLISNKVTYKPQLNKNKGNTWL